MVFFLWIESGLGLLLFEELEELFKLLLEFNSIFEFVGAFIILLFLFECIFFFIFYFNILYFFILM